MGDVATEFELEFWCTMKPKPVGFGTVFMCVCKDKTCPQKTPIDGEVIESACSAEFTGFWSEGVAEGPFTVKIDGNTYIQEFRRGLPVGKFHSAVDFERCKSKKFTETHVEFRKRRGTDPRVL